MDGWVSVVSKMEHNKIAVEIDHLSKAVRKKTLLKPLSFKLEQGKILAICGGNGAGKSTLIRLIVGLLRPTTGQVVINGLTKTKHKAKFLEQFGYMPDDFLFHPELTAEETIQFYADKMNITERRLNKATESVLGMGAKDLITQRIIEEAKRLLRYSDSDIKEISDSLGFSGSQNFSNFFMNHTEIRPKDFRKSVSL